MVSIQFMRVKGKAVNSYAVTNDKNRNCPEATGHHTHSLQRPREECGGSVG